MTTVVPTPSKSGIIYPSSDQKPVAETYDHLYAILTTLEVLRQYLLNRQATVLANQFLYYAEGFPKLRVAPDVMIIYDVEPGGRDNYKIWEEKQVPKVIFEITSKSTQDEDRTTKKKLYEALEVQEYWLFDPKGEWISQKLQGYRLKGDVYESITDNQSESLQLRLAVEGKLIGFYRLDNGQKLLVPDELVEALKKAEEQAEQERQRVTELESLLARYKEQFGELPEER
ncbi:Uma2 family endonuclease [Brasilonema sp. UFV-L1]|uniref:Uma2 family endonuclease n=1 Tax=Brasilonema sp. UFV-L1 TaxID=2234130 RepID=UPI00145F0D04|nr:Uma2 family endonuclease [Brasilonema sp. UFV-L1]NMG09429.1 Uma2 family endonuclease [Brasilonema sp. UFV-L1]